jgi:hypothetical protein
MWALAVAFGFALAAAQPASVQTEDVRIYSAAGQLTAKAVERRTDLVPPGGTLGGAWVVLFEPTGHVFLWTFEFIDPASPPRLVQSLKSHAAIYRTANKLVMFVARGSSLGIRESDGQASNIEDAMGRASTLAKAAGPGLLRIKTDQYKLVDLSGLGSDFFLLRNSAAPSSPPAVKSVAIDGGNWRLVLQGPNMDQAIVTLDPSYRVIDSRIADK